MDADLGCEINLSKKDGGAMKIYILRAGDWDNDHIVAIYSSEQLAQRAEQVYNSKLTHMDNSGRKYDDATFEEYEVLDNI